MPVAVRVDIPDIVKLNALLKKMPAEIRAEQKVAMDRSVAALVAEAKARVHTRRGNAPAGIKAKISPTGDSGKVNSTTRAARYSQHGRVAGKAPKASTIARVFGLAPDEAFLVARAIGRKGTQAAARPIMQRVYDTKRATIERLFHDALERVVDKR